MSESHKTDIDGAKDYVRNLAHFAGKLGKKVEMIETSYGILFSCNPPLTSEELRDFYDEYTKDHPFIVDL